MKIRIKFAKTGVMKFVGHLDVMRYFQKAIRRAELPPFACTILREEVYADIGTEEERKLVPLEALGEEVE